MADRGAEAAQCSLGGYEAYLSAEDSLAAWVDEACARSPGAWEPSTALFASWSNWANSAGEHPGSIKRFSQALESRGFTRIRQRRGGGNPVAGFDGLRLFQEPEPSWNDR